MTAMQKIIRYALSGLIAMLGSTACTLDIPYENQLSDPSAITSVTTARELLASAYDRLPNPEFELSVLSDDFETTSLISRNSDLGNLYNWQTLPMTNLALTLWQGYYESIAIANAVLERTVAISPQNDSEQADLAAVNAEAKALKAYCYFDLLRLFAPDISEGGSRDGVILKEQFELGFLPRSSIDACVSYIRTLLTDAVATENSPETPYWISRQGVRCLLAELELYAGQYEKAIEWANLVLTTAGGYDLFSETNYQQLWSGGAGAESLFSHHTTSSAALSGGAQLQPGEMSLAHNGVLFLDELPEFHRDVREALRQPLEDGVVTVSRAAGTVTYPSRFMLICAMNPCKCGWYGHPTHRCTCSELEIRRYHSRVSGPLLDRIDIIIEVPALEYEELSGKAEAEPSCEIKKRVDFARHRQRERLAGTGADCNAHMGPKDMERCCALTSECSELMEQAYNARRWA